MKHLSYRYGILTLFSICTLTGVTSNNQVLALTTEEEANRTCTKGSAAVVTVKNGNGHGSGFLVSQDGLIITNAHVVDGGPSVVTVVFRDGKQVPAQTLEGTQAWDTFMSLVATTRKLGISFFEYVRDRISQLGNIPSLGTIIREQSSLHSFGCSWMPE
jgi:S1-C subfamily serine protease